jgi:hypothetical protein
VEQLHLVMAELQVATVRNQVSLSLFTDFENLSIFKPAQFQENYVNSMLDQVIAWGVFLVSINVSAKVVKLFKK